MYRICTCESYFRACRQPIRALLFAYTWSRCSRVRETHKRAYNARVYLPECNGLGEMPGSMPETLTSICNKTHTKERKKGTEEAEERKKIREGGFFRTDAHAARLTGRSLFSYRNAKVQPTNKELVHGEVCRMNFSVTLIRGIYFLVVTWLCSPLRSPPVT